MKKKTSLLVIVALIALAVSALAAEKSARTFVFEVAMPRGTVAGKTAESWSKMLRGLFDIAKKETGIEVTSNIQMSMEQVMKDFEKKKAHMSFLLAPDYVLATDKKAPVTPVLNYKVKGEKEFEYCIYTKKGYGIEKVEDLRGKTIALEGIPKNALNPKKKYAAIGNGTAIFERIFLQKMLDNEGVKEGFDSFFGKVELTKNVEFSLGMVLDGSADAAIASERMLVIMVEFMPNFKKLVPLKCVCPTPYSAVVYRTGINDSLKDELTGFILKVHERDDFEEFREISGVEQFVEAKDSDYEPLRKLLAEARKKGWTEF
ncbi:MAG: PhnD/SsuA/transferrin family substrate-binding protein [bacterium]